jgi:hypothetical protein
MKHKQILFSLFLLATLVLAACGTQAATTEAMPKVDAASSEIMDEKSDDMISDEVSKEMSDDAMEADDTDMADMDDHKDDNMDDDMMSEGVEDMDDNMMAEDDDTMKDDAMAEDAMMVPDWFSTTLVGAKTGESFSVADFKGQVVLVETLAMWCSNCLKQQGQVAALHDLLGDRDDFVSLGIDIDPNENSEALKAYTSQNGFDWLYTVAPVEVARELGQLYGDQFLNPPSTPMLIIDRHGEVHVLPFGIKSAESLLEALQPFLEN